MGSNDGTITLQELDTCLENAHFPANISADLLKLREGLNISGEDSLIWRDFIALMMDKNLVMKEDNLRMVFEHFKKLVDNNSDGRIDFTEFRKMMEDENGLI